MPEMLCHTYCSDILDLEGMVDLELLIEELLSPHRQEEGRSCRNLPHTTVPCRRKHTCRIKTTHCNCVFDVFTATYVIRI